MLTGDYIFSIKVCNPRKTPEKKSGGFLKMDKNKCPKSILQK